MSHASVLVALSQEDIARAGGSVQDAVAYQMAPFDENGEWFKDGSRWDWWVVGGRYSGKFAPPGYDPRTDPANLEKCWLCDGTGKRDDDLGRSERARNPAYGCNGCGGTGKDLKHAPDWVQVGNVARRGDLSEEALTADARAEAEETWAEWEAEESPSAGTREFRYGIRDGETRGQYVERHAVAVSCFAFLRNREWHESGRLGWFGSVTATECERKADERGEEYVGRCIHKDDETGAKIVSWTGPKDNDDTWRKMFWRRFVRDLPDDTTLVVVDYHV